MRSSRPWPEGRRDDRGLCHLLSFPVATLGLIGLGLTGLLPFVAARRSTYGIYKGGIKAISAYRSKKLPRQDRLEAEKDIREVRRQAAAQQLALKQAEEQAAAILEKRAPREEASNRRCATVCRWSRRCRSARADHLKTRGNSPA